MVRDYPHLEEVAKEAIDKAKDKELEIIMVIDGFITDKEALHLRDMLWYARDKGVVVNFVPREEA